MGKRQTVAEAGRGIFVKKCHDRDFTIIENHLSFGDLFESFIDCQKDPSEGNPIRKIITEFLGDLVSLH